MLETPAFNLNVVFNSYEDQAIFVGVDLQEKKKEYLKTKIDALETNSKIKIFGTCTRGINDFRKGYQPRTNVAKDMKSDLVTDPHSILARWRKRFSQLLNVHGVNDARQTEIHTAEPVVPESSAFEVGLAIEKLKSHKSPSINQIPADLIKAGGRTIRYEIHKLTISIGNTEELHEE